MKILKNHQAFGGTVQFREHESKETKTSMKYSIFRPEGKIKGCLFYLAGLTCTDENFMAKAGAFQALNETGLMVVCPDTSPRGLHLPNEHESWDFGAGASFYVNATTDAYRDHYRMESYITRELYNQILSEFDVAGRVSIFGHSMGGHGALILGLRHPEKFCSISAFAPIVNPMKVPWGIKAFTGYLGSDQEQWKAYDASELIRAGQTVGAPILIDQGLDDSFLKEQLQPELIIQASQGQKQKVEVRLHEGYDHSYYFISSFVRGHIQYHAQVLTK